MPRRFNARAGILLRKRGALPEPVHLVPGGLGGDGGENQKQAHSISSSSDTVVSSRPMSSGRDRRWSPFLTSTVRTSSERSVLASLGEIGQGTSLSSCPWSSRTGTSMRSEEHTSELQSLMRISYAVFCLKKKQLQRSHN